MSYRLMPQVWNAKLTPTEKLVLLAITDFVNDEKGYAWPSQETLAAKTGLSRQTVNKVIKRLVRRNILISMRRSEKGKSTSNLYRINHVALVDTQTKNVAQNDNEVSISDTEVCKRGLHKPLGTLNEPLDSVTSVIEWNSSQPALPASNDSNKSFKGPPKDGTQFWSLPRNLRHFYARNSPKIMRDLIATGFTYDIHKDIA